MQLYPSNGAIGPMLPQSGNYLDKSCGKERWKPIKNLIFKSHQLSKTHSIVCCIRLWQVHYKLPRPCY